MWREQNSNLRKVVVVLFAIGFVGLIISFIAQSIPRKTDETPKVESAAEETPATPQPPAPQPESGPYAGWNTYRKDNDSLTFRYPNGWYANENSAENRVYLSSHERTYVGSSAPADYHLLWFSSDTAEAAKEREDELKSGTVKNTKMQGLPRISQITRGSVVIQVYEYRASGGEVLKAYWTDLHGKRYMATHAAGFKPELQAQMAAMLKRVLESVALK